MAKGTPLHETMQTRFPDQVITIHNFRGQATVVVKREGLLELARWLRDDAETACDFLMDLACVDYLRFGRGLASQPTMATPSPLPYYMKPKPMAESWERGVSDTIFRFEVVYHFFSTRHGHRVRVKVPLRAADPTLDSLTGLWRAADWFEREVWDMFGVSFKGHPNLKRILMYEGFEGYPLRKDYPVAKRQPLIGPVN